MQRTYTAFLAACLIGSSSAQDLIGTIDGTAEMPFTGASTAVPVGDLDNDGFGDFSLSFPTGLVAGQATGFVDIYSGATQSLLLRIPGASDGEFFGFSIDAADLDGDGVQDLVIGVPRAITPAGRVGQFQVYSLATGSLLLQVDGTFLNASFGDQISVVGDVNADGTPDILVGVDQTLIIPAQPGYAAVFSGSDGTLIQEVSSGTNVTFGVRVAPAGDIDADGHADFAVSDLEVGVVRIFSGSDGVVLRNYFGTSGYFGATLRNAGDVDGDGDSDLFISDAFTGITRVFSGKTGIEVRRFESIDLNLGFGGGSTGDLDGDNVPDLAVIGIDPTPDTGQTERFTHIYSGATGVLALRVDLVEPSVDVFPRAAKLGDVDGDGFGEFLSITPSDSGPPFSLGKAMTFGLPPQNGEARCLGSANSSGTRAPLDAFGTFTAADNDLTLVASNLPTGSVGLMLASPGYGVVVQPAGASGNLCLAGGPIGRYTGDVFQGPGSAFALTVDLTTIPSPNLPTFSTAALPGETWLWQVWYRDGGAPGESNFTDAIEITFD